jgi:hypothetical protein
LLRRALDEGEDVTAETVAAAEPTEALNAYQDALAGVQIYSARFEAVLGHRFLHLCDDVIGALRGVYSALRDCGRAGANADDFASVVAANDELSRSLATLSAEFRDAVEHGDDPRPMEPGSAARDRTYAPAPT